MCHVLVRCHTGDVTDALLEAWQQHISTDTKLFDRLTSRHREKHRRYHRLEHVDNVVRHVRDLAVQESVDDLDAVVAAAMYHDAIYEPESPANERASGRLARRDLAKLAWSEDRINSVVAMVEGTQDHTDPADIDTSVLFDADLAILGADESNYAAYVTAVRSEYRHLDDQEWVTGRADVVRSFISRPSIYATESGRSQWEDSAQRNLAAELVSVER
ncbi:MAG: putative metal-dependent HD superfamily phosphohydrolase [Candidatus Aldehydirespiratoraceae bacterium]